MSDNEKEKIYNHKQKEASYKGIKNPDHKSNDTHKPKIKQPKSLVKYDIRSILENDIFRDTFFKI